ncbi:hypothetical protein MMA94_25810, partial [Salmonella enterica]|nr:hypothetical protein [Salmonella enterica]
PPPILFSGAHRLQHQMKHSFPPRRSSDIANHHKSTIRFIGNRRRAWTHLKDRKSTSQNSTNQLGYSIPYS